MKKLYLFLTTLPTFLLATPNAPVSIDFTDVTATSVTVTWQDNSHSETGYKIFRDNEALPIATVGKSSTSFKDTGLTPNHEYTYIVKATDDQPTWVGVNSAKETFGRNSEPIMLDYYNLVGGDNDWLGVFAEGDALTNNNVRAYIATNGLQNGHVNVGVAYPDNNLLPSGRYKAVAFYNSSFHPEAISYFTITEELTIATTKDIYRTDEHNIVVDMTNAPTKGNNSDWLGIFKVGTPNERNSVYSWKYTNDTKVINGNGQPYGQVTLEDATLPEGDYEVRFFADDSYTLLTKSSFTVSDEEVVPTVYGQKGNAEVVKSVSDGDVDNHRIYAPKGVHNAPVVILLTGYSDNSHNNVTKYTGLMEFIASQGYYVIGLSWLSYGEQNVLSKLADAKRDGLADTSRVSIIGHSLGGSYVFDYLKTIREHNYGLVKNSVMVLDGWFAFDMTPTQMRTLDTTSLIIQYGGTDGIAKLQDPRILLSVYYMLANEKALLAIEGDNNHNYQNGSIYEHDYSPEEITSKQSLLKPVHAFLDYTLKGVTSAKSIAMKDDYQAVAQDIAHPNEADSPYKYTCSKDQNKDPNDILDYDACNLHSIISNRERWDR